MKILFAPSNIASFASILSEGLNKLDDVEAKGLSLGNNKYWTFTENWTVIGLVSWKKNPFKRFWQEVYKNFKLFQLICWADVIHWQWDSKGLSFLDFHYWLMKVLKKPVLVEWVGSDIRIPEIVFDINPYYKTVWDSGEYGYYFESEEQSLAIQQRFKKLGALPLVTPEMSLFLNRRWFPLYHRLMPRVAMDQYSPEYPSVSNSKPVIVHTPSALGAKGTVKVREIIKILENKGLSFEYREVTDMSKEESLKIMSSADIFLDQFVVGSYGMASCEAMTMGKPVFCYIMPKVAEMLPSSLPIVNTTLDELQSELEKYILSPELRNATGRKSRLYVEEYHNADKIAREMVEVYQAMLTKDIEKINKAVSL